MILDRKRRRLNENHPDKKSDDYNQSDTPIGEKSTVKSINKSILAAQGPADDDDENELREPWTMEMLMIGGNILMNMINDEESMSEDEKKFLYTREVHSHNSIQYHMHQIIEQQRVVDEYRNMTMEINESDSSRVIPTQI